MTTRKPTNQELKAFVEENRINVSETYNHTVEDVEDVVYPINEFIEEYEDSLIEQWQKEQPCRLTHLEIEAIYKKALAKCKSIPRAVDRLEYAITVCNRLLGFMYRRYCGLI